MKGGLFKFVVLVSAFIIVVGCTSSSATSSKGKNGADPASVSSKDNGKPSGTGLQDNKKNEETVRQFLKNQFTSSEALTKIFKKSEDSGTFGSYVEEVKSYIEKNYQSLVTKDILQDELIKANGAMRWLEPAYSAGYQLKPENIEIIKEDSAQANAYSFKVEVAYSKDGKTSTATVTGYINLNDNGKISAIRNIDDGGLANIFVLHK
ncbi:hypothetical protein ACFO4N_17915 [Camelliibacillus cellulosilyticus]|uniref:Lipoprotein n=1 Tax=Camelliibacillus cellulosilyticus TaxID=2174486 RepID=A0ABV9GTQ9_9BACL